MTEIKAQGARYEIIVDGKPRPYRDSKEVAFEAANFLKEQRPGSEMLVRDLMSEISVPVRREGERQK